MFQRALIRACGNRCLPFQNSNILFALWENFFKDDFIMMMYLNLLMEDFV